MRDNIRGGGREVRRNEKRGNRGSDKNEERVSDRKLWVAK